MTVGWPIFVAGLLAALLAAVVAGLLPALRARCRIAFERSTPARTTTGRGERRLLGAVAVLQIVLTVALLSGAVLMIRTAQNLAKVRPGYDTDNTLVLTVTAVQFDTWKDFHTRRWSASRLFRASPTRPSYGVCRSPATSGAATWRSSGSPARPSSPNN